MEPKTKTKSKSKSTKKLSPKVTSSKTVVENYESNTSENKLSNSLTPKNKKVIVIIVSLAILIAAVALLFKNVLIAATVNGQPISRISVIQELEKQNGKATLDNLITRTLVDQEAQNKGITASKEEVDKELETISKNVEAQGTTLDEALATQGMTKEQLVKDIELQIVLKKMISDKIKVTDKEVNDYVAQNLEQLPEGVTEAQFRTQAKAQLEQQKQQEETEKLITSLKEKAKINTFVTY